MQPDEEKRYVPAKFSPEAPWLTLVALGVNVTSTYLTGFVKFEQLKGLPKPPGDAEFKGYATWSGTSFATATITGEIARKMSLEGKSPQQARDDLLLQDPLSHGGTGWYQHP